MEEIKAQYKSKIRRPMSVHTRLSEDEFALVNAAALAANMPLADWFRSTVFTALKNKRGDLLQTLIHEDMQFLKMFMGTLFLPYLTGHTLTKEQIANAIREMRTAKIAASKKELAAAQDR